MNPPHRRLSCELLPSLLNAQVKQVFVNCANAVNPSNVTSCQSRQSSQFCRSAVNGGGGGGGGGEGEGGGPPTAEAKAEAKAGGGFSRPTKQDPSNEPTSLSVFALYITVSVCCSLLTSLGKYTQPLEASVGAAQETQARVVMAWGQTSRKAPSGPPEEKQVRPVEPKAWGA